MTLTLRTRVTAFAAIVSAALLVALGGLSYGILSRWLDREVTARLADLTDGLGGYLRATDDRVSVDFDPTDNDQVAFVDEATRYYQVYDVATGRLLAESTGFAPLGLHLTPAEVLAFAQHPGPLDIETEYVRLRVANRIRTLANGRAYLLQVGVSLAPTDAVLERYRALLLWGVPLACLVAGFVTWWLSSIVLRPLSRMERVAALIDSSTLDRRLPVRGVDDELDRVATAFNETLGRLERAVNDMRLFGTAMAHELRTPLAALRGEIELSLRAPWTSDAQRDASARQIEDLDRLTRLIDEVLTLSRAESGQTRLAMAAVDLGALTASVVEQLEPVALARSIALRCEQATSIVVEGDASWLERLLLNLLDNALKYTAENGQIVVRVFRAGETATLEVQDTGVGISTEDVPHVFEKFFQAHPASGAASGGAGLGLSLVEWIATQHRGAVSVRSRPGKGSTFTVTLPIRQS